MADRWRGEQWELFEPLLPRVKTNGQPEKHPRRAIVDGILYVVHTGCSWRQLPTSQQGCHPSPARDRWTPRR
jgi:transposase